MTGEPAAIEFRDHTGWAVAVALSGAPELPKFGHRERMELLAAELPRKVFHADAETRAERSLIKEVSEAARRRAADELGRVLRQLRDQNIIIDTVAIPAGTQALPPSLSAVLAFHTMLHEGEGELYRDCLADITSSLGLRTTRFAHRDLLSTAAIAIGRPSEELSSRASSMGRLLGPPWQNDHRDAGTAAWLGLAIRAVRN